jgi:hypothetical protein
MGIVLNKNNLFTITDNKGNTKFSLDKQMPHILHDISGTIDIPKIYDIGVDTTTIIINRTDDLVTLSNSYISSNIQDSFILPFFKITGGAADTDNKVISGIGSVIVRKIYQPSTKEFLGSSILNTVIENNTLKLVCNQHIDKTGFVNIEGDTDVSISYRIYYGRFK